MSPVIKIENRNGMLAVTCPYSRTWVSFAKMRGGTWSDGVRQWLFDPRDEFAVRSTLADIYGTDDYESCAKTDVRLALDGMRDKWDGYDRLFVCGREIARRKYYDSYVELGEGVVLRHVMHTQGNVGVYAAVQQFALVIFAHQIVYRACVHGCEAFQQGYIGLVGPSFIVGESGLRQAEHFAGLFQCPSSQFALGT